MEPKIKIKEKTKMKLRKILALAAAALMAVSVAGCSEKKSDDAAATTSAANNDAAQDNTASAGTIKFGTNAEFPPFEYVAANGVIDQYDGIDIAIAKQIADDNNMTPVIENMEFDSLLIALQNGQIDAVISGMTATDERRESVDFSTTYYTAKQVMIVKEDSAIEKASDMADKKIVVIQGYTGETCVKDFGYPYEAFKKGTEAILELINGKCDVVVIDSATALKYVGDNEGLKIVEDNDAFESEEYGIAVAKGNTEMLDKINATVEKMLADGTIKELSAKYAEAE